MASDTFIYTLGGVFPQALNFLLLPLYSRLLTRYDFGVLGYVNSITAVIVVTNSLSLNSYFLRQYFKASDKKEFTSTLFYFFIASNFIFVLLEMFMLRFAFNYFGIAVPFYPFMFLGLIESFFTSFAIIPLRYFRLEFKVNRYVAYSVAQVILTQGISIFLIYYMNMKAEGRLIGSAAAAGILAAFYFVNMLYFAAPKLNLSIIKSGLKFSLPLMWGAYGTILLSVADRPILERFVSVPLLGVYAISCSLAALGTMVVNAFAFVFEPLVYKIADSVTFLSDYLRLKDYFFFVVFSMVSFLIIFSKEIVEIMLPPHFAEAVNLVPFLVFSSLFVAIQGNYGQILMVANKTFNISMITFVACGFNIGLNVFLIPYYGIYAAAANAVFANMISSLMAFAYAHKEMKTFFNVRKEIAGIAVLLSYFMVITFFVNPMSFGQRVPIKALLLLLFFIFLLENYSVRIESFRRLIFDEKHSSGTAPVS